MVRNTILALVASLLIASVASAQGSTYRPLFKVTTHTATATLDRSDLQGNYHVNTGAAGAIVLSLPTCANGPVGESRVGLELSVFLTAAQDVDINPADADQISVLTNAAGDAISSAATAGNRITLRCYAPGLWLATDDSGVWTDVN